MKKIKIDDKIFRSFISTPTLEQDTRGVSVLLNGMYCNKKALVVGLDGETPFFKGVVSRLKFPYSIYSSENDILGSDIILITTLIDTGQTVDRMKKEFLSKGAKRVLIVSLIYRYNSYYDYHPNFSKWGLITGEYDNSLLIGIEIGDGYIVGWGLDYKGQGSDLNKIYVEID